MVIGMHIWTWVSIIFTLNMDRQYPDLVGEDLLLEVTETGNEPLLGSREGFHSLISYRRHHCATTIHVSDLYLQQRVIREAKSGEGRGGEGGYQEEAGATEEERRRERYFHPSASENERTFARCFHCGEHGHSTKHCPGGTEGSRCMYCLADHSSSSCNTKNCFHCNQMGHMARECLAQRTKCDRCGNRGHSTHHCGTIVFLNSTGMRFDKQFRDQYGFDDLARIRCLAQCKFPVGHFNCHQYCDIQDQFYQKGSLEKSRLRQKYILSTYSHLRENYFRQQIARAKIANKQPLEKQVNEGEQEVDMAT